MSLRIRKGTEQQRLGIVFDLGEIVWTTDGEKLYVGDGVSYGGKNIAAQLAGDGLSFDPVTGTLNSAATFTTDDVVEGENNRYFSPVLAKNAIWTALQAGQSLGNVTFTYDDLTEKLYGNVTLDGTGITSVSQDPAPSLGGNLSLNNHNITGSGDISITGSISAVGGLGANLNLNGHNISGTGSVSVSGTITASQGLGANLSLNSFNINGTGNINTTGDITVTGDIGAGGNIGTIGTIAAGAGLGYDLNLNEFNITGTGNINITGDVSATGDVYAAGSITGNIVTGDSVTGNTIVANIGLGNNLSLNEFNITGTGNINITGDVSATGTIYTPGEVRSGSVLVDGGKLTIDSNQLTSIDLVLPPNTSNGAGNDGVIYIGDEVLPATLWISSTKNFGVMTGLIGGDAGDGTALYYRTSRGTVASPTILTPGDRIAKNVAQGWDGEKYWHSGGYGIGTDPNETISLGIVPGRFEAQVRDHNGDPRSLFYTARGILTGAVLQPTTFADAAARDAALPVGVVSAGQMCFVTDSNGSGTPAFMGYNGTAWVTLG